MKYFLSFLFLVSFSLFLESAEVDSFEGTYRVSGEDPYEKKAYKGTARLVKGENGVYRGEWILDNGEKFTGTGLRSDEEIAFVFAVSQENQKGVPVSGLQLYKAKKEGLSGTWVYWNKTLLGHEILEKIPSPNNSRQ